MDAVLGGSSDGKASKCRVPGKAQLLNMPIWAGGNVMAHAIGPSAQWDSSRRTPSSKIIDTSRRSMFAEKQGRIRKF
jgi:hypothetical protein